jgi:hypothetical protein
MAVTPEKELRRTDLFGLTQPTQILGVDLRQRHVVASVPFARAIVRSIGDL